MPSRGGGGGSEGRAFFFAFFGCHTHPARGKSLLENDDGARKGGVRHLHEEGGGVGRGSRAVQLNN